MFLPLALCSVACTLPFACHLKLFAPSWFKWHVLMDSPLISLLRLMSKQYREPAEKKVSPFYAPKALQTKQQKVQHILSGQHEQILILATLDNMTYKKHKAKLFVFAAIRTCIQENKTKHNNLQCPEKERNPCSTEQ